MSDDIFHSWKEQRYIIAPKVLQFEEKLVILTDFNFWTEHVDELTQWCLSNGAKNQGMTVVFPDNETLMLFVLRWS